MPKAYKLAIVAAAVLLPAIARAQDQSTLPLDPTDYGMFGISGEATHLNFDVTNGFAAAVDGLAGNFIRQSDNGFGFDSVGGGGNMHVLFPLRDGPLGIDSFHFVFGGDAASQSEAGTILLGAGEALNLLPINGGTSPASINTPGQTDFKADTDFRRFYGAPTFGWGRENFTINVGPLVEFKTYDLNVDFTDITGAGVPGFAKLDETVDVWSAGPMLAAMARAPFGKHVSGFLGGQGAALWASGDLTAHQNLSIAGGLATAYPRPNGQ